MIRCLKAARVGFIYLIIINLNPNKKKNKISPAILDAKLNKLSLGKLGFVIKRAILIPIGGIYIKGKI